MNLRGYGNSRGIPYQSGFKIVIEAFLEELTTSALKNLINKYGQHPGTKKRLYFHGRSLGCATALQTAYQMCCDNTIIEQLSELSIEFSGVVLDSGFSSLANIGKEMLPFLEPCAEDVFHGENWDNIKILGKIKNLKPCQGLKFFVVNCLNDEICGK